MKLFKKGQTATEYLIILAVVIIIALIVIGALGGIPGIGRGATSRASASYWNSADVAITSYAITESDAVTLNMRNNLKNTIILNNITVGTDVMSTTNQNLAAGETKTFTGTVTGSNVCVTAGDTFSHSISIKYKDTATNTYQAFSGDGTKLEGKCAVG